MRAPLLAAGLAALAFPSFAAPVSFSGDLVPLLKSRCAICHLTGQEAGSMALHPRAAYGNLVGVASEQVPDMPRVDPGNPENSYLLYKLEGTHLDVGGTGVRMPFNEAPLDAAITEQFRRWIAEGGEDN